MLRMTISIRSRHGRHEYAREFVYALNSLRFLYGLRVNFEYAKQNYVAIP